MNHHAHPFTIIKLIIFLIAMPISYAATGKLFSFTGKGRFVHTKAILCLNGIGPVSCQNYEFDNLNISILTTIPNHLYPTAGIKMSSAGYDVSGCEKISNGYCLFSVSNNSAANIVISPTDYEMVSIASPNNANDAATGYGAVNYEYKIGKFDVTIYDYTVFLNSVAQDDTYNLYDPRMATDLNIAGISREGSAGKYLYKVINNSGVSANRPITYVTWFDAARYANWMSNGKPVGTQNSTTTENGAYNLNGAISGQSIVKNNINPNTGAPPRYYIPLENEWYKAAYYNPTSNTYSLYATQSNTAPGNTIGNLSNQANYFIASGNGFSLTQSLFFGIETLNYLTDVGDYINSPSYFGTFDQNGNVNQWNNLNGTASLYGGLRGGFFFSRDTSLKSIILARSITSNANSSSGFRLASPN